MEMRKLVKKLRDERRLTEAAVCAGVCSESQYRNYENGHRDLNIFVQKRIMERLGCCSGRMQYILKNKEYKCWKDRTQILCALMEGRLAEIPERLNQFEQKYGDESLHKQYAERMRSFYIIINNGNTKEVLMHIENAIACTVPGYSDIKQQDQLLSSQEWDLLLDYFYYQEAEFPEVFRGFAKRIEESYMEEREKGNAYCKAAMYYIEACKQLEDIGNWKAEKLIEGYHLVNQALSYLREQKNGNFMKEILEVRGELLECLSQGVGFENEYYTELEQNRVWLNAVLKCNQSEEEKKGIWINYQPYMMRNVESICDILARRMDMLEIGKEQMAKELYVDERTIMSIRGGRRNPQKAIAEVMLGRMGLPRRYTKEFFFVERKEEEEFVDRLIKSEKFGFVEETERLLDHVEETVNLDMYFNMRETKWHKLWLDYHEGKLTRQEGAKEIKEIIEECFPWGCLGEKKDYYFSYNELQYMCGFLILADAESEDFKTVCHRIEQYCQEKMNTDEEMNYASVLVMLIDCIQSIYGNKGEYAISNRYCKDELRVSRKVGNMYRTEDILYAMWWNKKEETKTTDVEMLSWLIDLANLIGDFRGEAFMKKKLASVGGR